MRVYRFRHGRMDILFGTERGIRTLTTLRPPVFETGASTIPPSRRGFASLGVHQSIRILRIAGNGSMPGRPPDADASPLPRYPQLPVVALVPSASTGGQRLEHLLNDARPPLQRVLPTGEIVGVDDRRVPERDCQ